MQVWQIVAIVVVIAIAVVAGLWAYERARSRRLRERFGSEYDRRVNELGDRRRAETELARSESRVRKMKVQRLSDTERSTFTAEWKLCQARFVDDPGGAVNEADRILIDIMRARGYSVDDPHDRVADVCAAYPDSAEAYREASNILVRHRQGEATTEDLRTAFVNYRALFDDILGGRDEELRRVA